MRNPFSLLLAFRRILGQAGLQFYPLFFSWQQHSTTITYQIPFKSFFNQDVPYIR